MSLRQGVVPGLPPGPQSASLQQLMPSSCCSNRHGLAQFESMPLKCCCAWRLQEVIRHTMVHEQLIQFYKGFRHDAHPMAIMVGVTGALSAFYASAADIRQAAGASTQLSPLWACCSACGGSSTCTTLVAGPSLAVCMGTDDGRLCLPCAALVTCRECPQSCVQRPQTCK